MGTFIVEIAIGDQARERWVAMDTQIDTGASITSMSGSILRELGVEPVTSERLRFAQDEVRTMQIGYTWLRFAGKEILTRVLFNEENSPAPEGARLGVNPVDGLMMTVESI